MKMMSYSVSTPTFKKLSNMNYVKKLTDIIDAFVTKEHLQNPYWGFYEEDLEKNDIVFEFEYTYIILSKNDKGHFVRVELFDYNNTQFKDSEFEADEFIKNAKTILNEVVLPWIKVNHFAEYDEVFNHFEIKVL